MRLRELICRHVSLVTIDQRDRLEDALTAPRGLSGVEIHPDGVEQSKKQLVLAIYYLRGRDAAW